VTEPAKRPATRDLSIIAGVALVLAYGLPLADALASRDTLLSVWSSYGWLVSGLVVTVLVPLIVSRKLYQKPTVVRIAAAPVAGVLGCAVAFGGSLVVNDLVYCRIADSCKSNLHG
jgi:hypothetical protein